MVSYSYMGHHTEVKLQLILQERYTVFKIIVLKYEKTKAKG